MAIAIEIRVRPWGCNNEKLVVGGSDSRLYVDKDARLKISKEVNGKWMQNSSSIDYLIQIPDGFNESILLISSYHGKRSEKVLFSPVPAKKDSVLSFGKYAGKKFSEVPISYLKWLCIHKSVLKTENQNILGDVKAFLK
jgi:hypothetical protein